jgi:hypothetical protein
MPLEGKALAIASAMVNRPQRTGTTLQHPLGPRTSEKGGVQPPSMRRFGALE